MLALPGTAQALTVDEATYAALGSLDPRWLVVALLAHGAALLCWAGRLRGPWVLWV